MVKRLLPWVAALLLLPFPGFAETLVARQEGEMYFPEEKNWVYHFSYAYPYIQGEDYTSALINDTYDMALNEMTHLVLPMFANAPDMRFDGKNEVLHDFTVPCNNGKVLSILQSRTQTRGEEGTLYALEPLTFDVSGQYAGETLTLRGVTLIQAGVDGDMLDEAEPEMYPSVAHIIDGSSNEMAEALLPALYQELLSLQKAGVIRQDCSYEDFLAECSPTRDFYTDEQNRLVFFFPPMLMAEPSLDAPIMAFSPEELDALLAAYWEG